MRHLIIAIALALLSGCLGGGGGGGGGTSTPPVPSIEIAGLNRNVIVSASVRFDLIVSATAATVTVAPNQRIRNLTISGVDDDVFIGSTSSVSGTVTLSGSSSVLHLPAGSPISVNVTGSQAAVVYDSSSG